MADDSSERRPAPAGDRRGGENVEPRRRRRWTDDPDFKNGQVTITGSTLYLIVHQHARMLERLERLERRYGVTVGSKA
jgi:hypothetical protein